MEYKCPICFAELDENNGKVIQNVRMTCPASHLICFPCIVDFFYATKPSGFKCPICRRSNGSFYCNRTSVVKASDIITKKKQNLVSVDKNTTEKKNKTEMQKKIDLEEQLSIKLKYDSDCLFSPKIINDFLFARKVMAQAIPVIEEEVDNFSIITSKQMMYYVKNIKWLRLRLEIYLKMKSLNTCEKMLSDYMHSIVTSNEWQFIDIDLLNDNSVFHWETKRLHHEKEHAKIDILRDDVEDLFIPDIVGFEYYNKNTGRKLIKGTDFEAMEGSIIFRKIEEISALDSYEIRFPLNKIETIIHRMMNETQIEDDEDDEFLLSEIDENETFNVSSGRQVLQTLTIDLEPSNYIDPDEISSQQ